MKKLLFIFLFPILAFGQKAFQPKVNGWWYLQGITTKPTHNLIGVRDSNSTSDKAQINLFGDVTIKNLAGVGYATFDANGKIGKSTLATDVQGIVNTNAERTLKTFQADVVQTGATAANLYSYSIPANTFLNDGDMVDFYTCMNYTGTSPNVYVDFNGSNLYGLSGGTVLTIDVKIVRLSATSVKIITDKKSGVTYFTTITGLDLSTALPIVFRGVSGVTGTLGVVTFMPGK